MTDILELNEFFIDTVHPAHEVNGKQTVQLVRYSVIGKNAEDAVRRFIEEEAGVEAERTEPTDFIIVGVFSKENPIG